VNISLLSNLIDLELHLSKQEADVLFNQALLEFQVKRYGKAVDILQIITVAYSDDLDYLMLIALAYKELKEYQLAFDYFSIVKNNAASSELIILMADCAILQKEYDVAKSLLANIDLNSSALSYEFMAKYKLLNKFLGKI